MRDSRVGPGVETVLAPLRASELFRSLDEERARRLARHLVRRRYRADEVVFHAGDPGDRLHVIESGRVRIGLASEEAAKGPSRSCGPARSSASSSSSTARLARRPRSRSSRRSR